MSKPTIVGIYGIPGAGKSYLLNQLKHRLNHNHYAFYEGSEMISKVAKVDLDSFKDASESIKRSIRELTMQYIKDECAGCGKVGIVVGHYMFWRAGEESGNVVWTKEDSNTYTHILYLDTTAETVARRCSDDTQRTREDVTTIHRSSWVTEEKTQLRSLCYNHGIFFTTVSEHLTFEKAVALLHEFRTHSKERNLMQAQIKLDQAVEAGGGSKLKTMLVLDGDKTLAAADTSEMFWQKAEETMESSEKEPLKHIFDSTLGYSYEAFRQATLLYEEHEEEFEHICHAVASNVSIHPEFVSLLEMVQDHETTGAVVISCGLRRVWEKVLEKEGLSGAVNVIASGRFTDCVVTADVKKDLVARLQKVHKMYVYAFGDSPLDLPMLKQANEGIVVVCGEEKRSKSMEHALRRAVDEGLRARQALLPNDSPPRLDGSVPIINVIGHSLVDDIFRFKSRPKCLKMHHESDANSTKLLMTPTRNAEVSGPALQEAHKQVGRYLAIRFLSDAIGLEEYSTPHVQGNQTAGYRLLHEQKTLIVALMRGGEPMARGVHDVFPLAAFLHAKNPSDVSLDYLQRKRTVVLVESVVNSGKTVVEFVEHVRKLHGIVRIVIVTGWFKLKLFSMTAQ